MTGIVHEYQYTLVIICRSVLPSKKTVSDKFCKENCFRQML